MSWTLIVTMREGRDEALPFETEEGAKAALEEVNKALAVHPRQQIKPITIDGRLVVRPADVRSAKVQERQEPRGGSWAE